MNYFARWTEDRKKAQPLKQHLLGVAEIAYTFAKSLGISSPEFVSSARLSGLLHDLGKYRIEFQNYLNRGNRGLRSNETVHAIYGAAAAESDWNALAAVFAIGGHHAGLHDQDQLASQLTSDKFHAMERYQCLLKIADSSEELAGLIQELKATPSTSDWIARLDLDGSDKSQLRRLDVYTRMLFSILVDADRLDSEKFEQSHLRKRDWTRPVRVLNAAELMTKLEKVRLSKSASSGEGELNMLRNSVFNACRVKGANCRQGFFSLTVPTGGGKTLSSMAFGLSHAAQHELRRVIVVIPYLSIIEQNAREYRKYLGAENVLEHHSSVAEPLIKKNNDSESIDEPSQTLTYEQLAENWDCPIVVTTSVQFIESLFASATNRARKLHNIARSVVIFDEVQTLPTHLLDPTLDMLRVLQREFGLSVLFCSATQPAFRRSSGLKQGFQLGEIEEIAPDPTKLFTALTRVSYRIEPTNDPWGWDRVAQEMLGREKCLCIVNLKRHASELFDTLRQSVLQEDHDGIFHLSASMCAAHRLDVLGLSQDPPSRNSINARLSSDDKRPCRVVSTQLIESGVDIDFPCVFRAMGPLDSIVQAAGRCNREGKLRTENGVAMLGEVVVFQPVDMGIPNGIYAQATAIAPGYLSDPVNFSNDPNLFGRYFDELYEYSSTDGRGKLSIQQLREALKFRQVAELGKVINEDTKSVIVPYGWAAKAVPRIQKLRRLNRSILRRLQRYTVNMRNGPGSLFQQLVEANRLTPLLPESNIYVLDRVCYDPYRGVVFKGVSPEELFG